MISWIVVMVLAVLGVVVLANAYVLLQASGRVVDMKDVEHTPVGVVLGARVYPDGSVSPVLQDRLDTAMELHARGMVERLLVSGASGPVHCNEVRVMQQYLLHRGIPPSDILVDEAGHETWASMHRAQSVFGLRRVVVVTQRFHLSRALFLAHLAGLDAQGVAADRRPYAHAWRNQLRETAARVKAVARAVVG